MDKKDYLIRTLSRTKRKDFENYVVNAVWNRLGMHDIKPVTQQTVFWPDGHHSFIDLYFPQLGLGIECDEEYHKGDEQHERDMQRELTIIDVLRQIKGENYTALHVDASKTYEDFEQDIDFVVNKLKDVVSKQKAEGTFVPWKQVDEDWKAYFANKEAITISDDIGFPRIVDAINMLCDDDKKGYQTSYFIPAGFRESYGDKYHLWCPKLAIEGKAVARGWNNQLMSDGVHIEEFNESNPGAVDPVGPEGVPTDLRVTFAQMVDPVTRVRAYRFVGVFRRIANNPEGTRKRYERISDSFPVIHKR